jgi:alpha-ketoglutarate-dependent 2,4-dichlorophenoxyacetate dioxygenase
MAIKIKELAPTFGAEVSGVDLTNLSDAEFNDLKAAMEKYGVVVLRSTNLDDKTQIEFGRKFGTLDTATAHHKAGVPARLQYPELFDISNLNIKGEICTEIDAKRNAIARANTLWHTDGHYNPLRTSYSMLRAVELPPAGTGGHTEFIDCRAAYDDLSNEQKAKIKDLVGMNNMAHRVKVANEHLDLYQRMDPMDYPFAKHKLSLIHQATGRPTIYLCAYTHHIEGLGVEEGKALCTEIFDHLKQEKYQLPIYYENPGDFVIWDNTSVLHRATGGEFAKKYRRDMRRISLLDDGPDAMGLNSPNDLWKQGAP